MRLGGNGDELAAPRPVITFRAGQVDSYVRAAGVSPEELWHLDRIAYAEARRRQGMDPAELALEDLVDAELERRLLYGP